MAPSIACLSSLIAIGPWLLGAGSGSAGRGTGGKLAPSFPEFKLNLKSLTSLAISSSQFQTPFMSSIDSTDSNEKSNS